MVAPSPTLRYRPAPAMRRTRLTLAEAGQLPLISGPSLPCLPQVAGFRSPGGPRRKRTVASAQSGCPPQPRRKVSSVFNPELVAAAGVTLHGEGAGGLQYVPDLTAFRHRRVTPSSSLLPQRAPAAAAARFEEAGISAIMKAFLTRDPDGSSFSVVCPTVSILRLFQRIEFGTLESPA